MNNRENCVLFLLWFRFVRKTLTCIFPVRQFELIKRISHTGNNDDERETNDRLFSVIASLSSRILSLWLIKRISAWMFFGNSRKRQFLCKSKNVALIKPEKLDFCFLRIDMMSKPLISMAKFRANVVIAFEISQTWITRLKTTRFSASDSF